jgi:hypothetical protein
MNNIPTKILLPEEVELARLEAEQADLKEKVTTSELALETIKTETARFQHRYYQAVGQLYAQLDELDAQIAKAKLKQKPDDETAKAQARAAEQKAKKSAAEAGLIDAQPRPPQEIRPELKQAYRQAIKLMHPDLAITEHERKRRTELMAQVNLAYERGDLATIEKLIKEYGEDPEAIVGEDVASRIVKTIRRIAQLRRRLDELQLAIEAQRTTEIFQLKQNIEDDEAKGKDPLGDLAEQLMRDMSERKMKLKTVQQ